MSDGKEPSQRRVYVLPSELVERVVEFQKEKNLPSEVEAVRRLLDEALKHRDTGDAIAQRMVDRIRAFPLPSDAARDILLGHPLLDNISFDVDAVSFRLRGFGEYRVDSKGKALWRSSDRANWVPWPIQLDDEIPF